ncbi:hypothetical protein [Hyphomicrobium sp. D-2]|nr:hypothetical protein [Hyphomicrobium sp. D-2]MDH4980826.1 hypothetical protein [Hyphomicrobium sp. D-2]
MGVKKPADARCSMAVEQPMIAHVLAVAAQLRMGEARHVQHKRNV